MSDTAIKAAIEAAEASADYTVSGEFVTVSGISEMVRAAIAAYEAALWQPIETAPLDGTVILLWNGKVRQGCFDRVDNAFVATIRSPTKRFAIANPTRWRHLPPVSQEHGQ